MADSAQNVTPSQVFPLPGFSGPITAHHGDPNAIGGSDIMAPVGTPVVSMVSGKVSFISTQATASTSGGNAVEITAPNGLSYYYAHLQNPVNLKVGDNVLAGQSLGAVDNSGNAATTPSHLHIGIGYGIQAGLGAYGGLGKNYNAVASLQALEKDPRANDVAFADPTAAVNPPQIQFIPSVPGFTSANLDTIKMIISKAMAAGIDPFIALGIASKESSFDNGAVNRTSGACGVMQIYPCIPLDVSGNIDEGLKRLKSFLTTCNGNMDCALNYYSGGGGASYSNDVKGRANAIKTANPGISLPGFSTPPSTQVGGGGSGGFDGTPPPSQQECPPIHFGNVGPAEINIPNPVCLVATALKNMTDKLGNWWSQWQLEHIPNWVFVILGIIFIIVGAVSLAQSAGVEAPNISIPENPTADAPGLADVAAVL